MYITLNQKDIEKMIKNHLARKVDDKIEKVTLFVDIENGEEIMAQIEVS